MTACTYKSPLPTDRRPPIVATAEPGALIFCVILCENPLLDAGEASGVVLPSTVIL